MTMLNALLLASILAVTIPPATTEFISDGADLLTPTQEQELQKVFEDVYARQSTRLGLLTLADLDDDPKAVSVRAINYWKMSPDSVLVMVSMNPRKIYIQPGSNLQYRFDESTSVGIIRDSMAPNLKAGRYGAGILNGFHAISNRLPGQATPPPNTVAFTEPMRVNVSPGVTTDSGTTTGHPVLIFFLVSGLLLGGFFLVRYVIRRNQEAKEAEEREDATYRRMLEQSRAENERRRLGTQAPPSVSIPRVTPSYRERPAPAPTQNTTVIHHDSGGNDLANAVVLNHILTTQPAMNAPVRAPAPAPRPPPTPPRPSPPRRSSYDSDSSSYGGGGGGFDFGGGDSGGGGSDGGGGGGGDF